ncbi:hypothetical protein MMPV_008336 [Pyropia vietnamensis]
MATATAGEGGSVAPGGAPQVVEARAGTPDGSFVGGGGPGRPTVDGRSGGDVSAGDGGDGGGEERRAVIADAVRTILRCIDEDPSRPGLAKTPERVAASLCFLTSGARGGRAVTAAAGDAVWVEAGLSDNQVDADDCWEGRGGDARVLNDFDGDGDGDNNGVGGRDGVGGGDGGENGGGSRCTGGGGVVLVRDIDVASLCEHHLLPFVGRAHVAYLPLGGRLVGLSKIARLVVAASQSLQVQERLTTTIADAVARVTGARGVAVLVEAKHICMAMRGVEQVAAQTVTTCWRGAYAADAGLREEYLALLGR